MCVPSPCNYGTCRDSGTFFTCSCWDGYEGDRCDREINECRSNPCVRGFCIDGVNSYECQCPTGYDGTQCELTSTPVKESIRHYEFDAMFQVPRCLTETDDLFHDVSELISSALGRHEGEGITVHPGACLNARRQLGLDNDATVRYMDRRRKLKNRKNLIWSQTFESEIWTNNVENDAILEDSLEQSTISNFVESEIAQNSGKLEGLSFEGSTTASKSVVEENIFYQWERSEWDIEACPTDCDRAEQITRTREVNCLGSHGLIGADSFVQVKRLTRRTCVQIMHVQKLWILMKTFAVVRAPSPLDLEVVKRTLRATLKKIISFVIQILIIHWVSQPKTPVHNVGLVKPLRFVQLSQMSIVVI
eukprot:UN30850